MTIKINGNPYPATAGQTILQVMQDAAHGGADIHVDAPCAGRGVCGKCSVQTTDGVSLACQTPALTAWKLR